MSFGIFADSTMGERQRYKSNHSNRAFIAHCSPRSQHVRHVCLAIFRPLESIEVVWVCVLCVCIGCAPSINCLRQKFIAFDVRTVNWMNQCFDAYDPCRERYKRSLQLLLVLLVLPLEQGLYFIVLSNFRLLLTSAGTLVCATSLLVSTQIVATTKLLTNVRHSIEIGRRWRRWQAIEAAVMGRAELAKYIFVSLLRLFSPDSLLCALHIVQCSSWCFFFLPSLCSFHWNPLSFQSSWLCKEI